MSSSFAPQPDHAGTSGRVVILMTGIPAAGKSTIAQLLAERLPQSVHVRGDLFRRMVVNGRADMTPEPTDEAIRQLRLRYRLTATVTDAYFRAGFTVVTQDVILGDHLAEMTTMIRSRPLLVVVLAPDPTAIATREANRGKVAYDRWAVDQLDEALRHQTPLPRALARHHRADPHPDRQRDPQPRMDRGQDFGTNPMSNQAFRQSSIRCGPGLSGEAGRGRVAGHTC